MMRWKKRSSLRFLFLETKACVRAYFAGCVFDFGRGAFFFLFFFFKLKLKSLKICGSIFLESFLKKSTYSYFFCLFLYTAFKSLLSVYLSLLLNIIIKHQQRLLFFASLVI
uniref:Uncharacterized protein n=1 Tax=Lepeophtheirus salmonis TaxID=72036 RepID=A0A0K2TDI6_LEPSM